MKRTFLALALIASGATGASAQGYGGWHGGNAGYYGYRHRPPVVVVIPPRHRHLHNHWRPWHRWHRHPRPHRWGW